jgi:hypothetical protein
MQLRAKDYQIVDNELYMASVSGPLLRCISKQKAKKHFRIFMQEFAEVTSVPVH